VSETLCVRPPEEAEMLTLADAATALVVMLNVVLVAPAAIVTLAGTDAAGLLLEARPGRHRWSRPVEAHRTRKRLPPVTLAWLRLTARHARRHHGQRRGLRRAAVGGGDAHARQCGHWLVVTLNVALVAPAVTVTVAGTVTAGLSARGRLARRQPAPGRPALPCL